MAIHKATLAKTVNGVVEYIYPKTTADIVVYDDTYNVYTKIESLVDLIGDAGDSITTINTTLTSYGSRLTAVESKASTNASNITTLQNKLSSLTTTVNTNTSNISNNADDIATLQSTVATNAKNISTNASDITTLKSSVSTNTSDISTLKTNVSTNTTNISTNTSDIAALKTRMTTAESDIDTAEANIKTLQSSVSTNTSNISSLTTQVSTNTSDIATLKSNLETLSGGTVSTDDYSTLNSEVVDIRTGYDDTVYDSAGEAVRTQISDLHDLIDALYDGYFLDPLEVNGEEYETSSGETLYLTTTYIHVLGIDTLLSDLESSILSTVYSTMRKGTYTDDRYLQITSAAT